MSDDRSTDPRAPRRRGWSLRLFSRTGEEPRARRAGDVVLLVMASIGIALLSLVAVPPSRIEAGLVEVIGSLPQAAGLWGFVIGALGLGAVFLALVTLVGKRWGLLRDMALVTVMTMGLGLVVGRLVQGAWGIVWGDPAADAGGWAPRLGLAVPAAVVLVALPHLTHPARRAGWWTVILASFSSAMLSTTPPSLALGSVLISVVAASTIHLGFGSCRGRPDVATVSEDLAALGIAIHAIGPAERQSAGVFVLEAEDGDGRRLDVKVYGRDAYDTQRLTTLWRTIWLRGPGAPTSPGRLQQVEHEAFLTLLAGQAGVLTQPVVTAGLAPSDDALLVLGEVGHPVADEEWTATAARQLWEALDRLHRARIAHGQVDARHLIADEGRMGLTDFRGARVSSDPWHRHVDHAQALVTSVLALGTRRALDVALEALGPTEMGDMLPFLQSDPLTPHQRRGLREADLDVDDLRAEAARRIGVEPPELERLRRVTWGSALRTALPILAFFALASVVSGLDLNDLADSLADASWWFVGVGLVVAQVPRLFQAVSALGASPVPVPLGQLYLLQLAQSYIALTIPGGAARIALNVRFFQRQGLSSGSALTVGALDSFAGFLGQLCLLGLLLLFTSATIDLDLDTDTTDGLVRLAIIAAGVVAAVAIAVLAIPRFRRPVVERVRVLLAEAWSAIRGLASPRRLGMLFGGNIGNEILLAVALGAFALGLGEPIGLPELLFVNITVSIFAGVIPIPGGIGVVEGALIFGLARAGMPEPAAFAAAILYRFSTFYLPPIWGFFAFRSLERHKHL